VLAGEGDQALQIGKVGDRALRVGGRGKKNATVRASSSSGSASRSGRKPVAAVAAVDRLAIGRHRAGRIGA
jgi:hypothetical protein